MFRNKSIPLDHTVDARIKKDRLRKQAVANQRQKIARINPATGSFVPLFESNGIITELDCVVFSEVCGQICRWMDAGLPVGPVSVNVSRLHVYHPHFTEKYQSILAHHGIPPAYSAGADRERFL